jgi:hypothetical protein
MSKARTKTVSRTVQVAVVLIASVLFPVGLMLDEKFVSALTMYSFDWSPTIPDEEAIRSLWLGVLGVHGAVAAIAPVLGFTLLTTAATPATRLAPAGFVVAEAIGWRLYLFSALALLAISIVACVSAQSLFGLVVATLSAVYVISSTLWKFWVGFTLLRDEERFDACARQYLEAVVVKPPEETEIDKGTAKRLEALNKWLGELPAAPSGHRGALQQVRVGERARTTELLSISTGTAKKIAAKAEKLGVLLYSTQNFLSAEQQSSKKILAVALVKRAAAGAVRPDDIDTSEQGMLELEEKCRELQRTFDGLVEYGLGPWASSQMRIPLLVTRHLSTTLYEAIPGHRPHDLEYGLEVLGNLIDKITDAQSRELIGPPAYQWVYDTPANLAKQLSRMDSYDAFAFSELLGFLRVRIASWVSRGHTNSAIRYLWLVQFIVLRAIKEGGEALSGACLYVRETPFLAQKNRNILLREIGRTLIVCILNDDYVDDGYRPQRRKVAKTVVDMFDRERYRVEDEAIELVLEAYVSLLATTMLKSAADPKFNSYPAEVLEIIRSRLERANITLKVFLALLDNIDAFVNRWRWEWWESEHQEEGEAHFVSIEMWCIRAAIVLMGVSRSWRLGDISDEDLPGLSTFIQIERYLGGDRTWLEQVAQSDLTRVERLFGELKQRQERIQELRVRYANPDVSLCQNYVRDLKNEIEEQFHPFNSWLAESGFVQESAIETDQVAGVDFLVPKSAFVPQELLDVHTVLSTPSVGSAIVDFEIKAMARQLEAASTGVIDVDDASSTAIWDYVLELVERNEVVFIIGLNVSKYDVFDQLERVEQAAAQLHSRAPRFFTVFDDSHRVGFLIGTPGAVSIVRYPPPEVEGAISYEVVEGVIAVSLAPVSGQEMEAWARNTEGDNDPMLREKYLDSLVSRTQWKFEARAGEALRFRSFEIQRNREPE